MSASLLVDLNNTCYMGVSINDAPFLSGGSVMVGSGVVIGQTVDLLHANTFCNLFAAGVTQSGQLRLQIQTADNDVSGQFTDPTSGLPQLPTSFSSGGLLWLNSGGTGGGVLGAQVSGQSMYSGFFVAAGFQRIGRYARVNTLSEGTAQFAGALQAGFISNLRATGSGGGFSYSPTSGTVNV